MSRGDQRERDRAKRQAKDAAKKTNQREGTPAQRNQDDKAKLLAKVEAKKAKQEADAQAEQNKAKVIKKKKVQKQEDSLSDLLSAGLNVGKKKKK